jgi:hypothetical protein
MHSLVNMILVHLHGFEIPNVAVQYDFTIYFESKKIH